MQRELPESLATGKARVLKRARGHSGDGVWKVELGDQAGKIANAITVAVEEGLDMQLVYDGILVPKGIFFSFHNLLLQSRCAVWRAGVVTSYRSSLKPDLHHIHKGPASNKCNARSVPYRTKAPASVNCPPGIVRQDEALVEVAGRAMPRAQCMPAH